MGKFYIPSGNQTWLAAKVACRWWMRISGDS